MWSKHVRSTLLATFKSIIAFLTIVTALHIRCPELTSIYLKTYPWTTPHLVCTLGLQPILSRSPLPDPGDHLATLCLWVPLFEFLHVRWHSICPFQTTECWMIKIKQANRLTLGNQDIRDSLGYKTPGPGYKIWLRLQRASKKKIKNCPFPVSYTRKSQPERIYLQI